MLIDNINFLLKRDRSLREYLVEMEANLSEQSIKVIDSKEGSPTLEVTLDSTTNYIHSKYNPLQEAEKFVEQFHNDIENYESVLFYGLGLGYHVEAFLNKFQNLNFSLYEPNPAVFSKYMSNRSIRELPLSRLKYFHVERDEQDMTAFLSKFAQELNEKVLLVILPSYERIFKEQCTVFVKKFKDSVLSTRQGLHTNIAFEKRWTVNSAKNFIYTMKTPNVLRDIDNEVFTGKPALLVAAGPSLSEEIENIKYIKKNGLAYIFSVGSAINELIEHDIIPDAQCTYDPTILNQQVVFRNITERGINTIPLIFGTSVGFEVLEHYNGPKAHVITTQDTVSSFYLTEKEEIEKVNDAPSIAVLTLELLYKLGCSPIILVGQNLAYRDKELYSKRINYKEVTPQVIEAQQRSGVTVSSVDGNEILSNPTFIRMKNQIEMYVNKFENIQVINSTKGGANIEGVPFMELDNIIEEKFTQSVVENNWFNTEVSIKNQSLITSKQKEMEIAYIEFYKNIDRVTDVLREMDRFTKLGQTSELNRTFSSLDKEFKRLRSNSYYKVFIAPMVRVQHEIMVKNIQKVRFDTDIVHKGSEIVDAVAKFILECKNDNQLIAPIFSKIRNEINEVLINPQIVGSNKGKGDVNDYIH